MGGTGVEPTWQVFAEDLPVQSGSFDLEFVGPEHAVGRYLLVALEVVDPLDRRWIAYSRDYIGVVADPAGDGSEGESESDESGQTASDDGDGGCGCSLGEGSVSPTIVTWIGLLMLVDARRRRFAI